MHLGLRCQFHLMLFPCSNFSFKSCLQCCDLTSELISGGLNGNEYVGKQTAYIYVYVPTYMVYTVVQELRNVYI